MKGCIDPVAEMEWRLTYAEELKKVAGLTTTQAEQAAEHAEVDLECDPVVAAWDEMSYWEAP